MCLLVSWEGKYLVRYMTSKSRDSFSEIEEPSRIYLLFSSFVACSTMLESPDDLSLYGNMPVYLNGVGKKYD
jgi:hypothetical protein